MDSSPIEACNLSAWQKKYIAAGSIKPEDKNMKLKRLAAAILAAAMIAAVFAGCSSKKPEATETFGAIVGTEDEKYSKYFLGIGHPNWNRWNWTSEKDNPRNNGIRGIDDLLDWEYSKYQMRYDNAGNLLKVDDYSIKFFLCFPFDVESEGVVTEYQYDNDGHIRSVRFRGQWPNRRYMTCERDDRGRISKTVIKYSSNSIITLYVYDDAGNIVEENSICANSYFFESTLDHRIKTVYTYDENGCLIRSMSTKYDRDENFENSTEREFDPQTGARTKETKTYIRGVEECTYENDKYGNPTTIKTCRIKNRMMAPKIKNTIRKSTSNILMKRIKLRQQKTRASVHMNISDHAGWTTYYTETTGGCGDFNESKKNPCGGAGAAHACFVCRLQEKQK